MTPITKKMTRIRNGLKIERNLHQHLREILRDISRLLKNTHLRRYPHPSSLRRTSKYASLLRISEALHLAIFEQPMKIDFSSKLLEI